MNIKRNLALAFVENSSRKSTISVFICIVKRPPVEDILSFLQSEDWIVQNMFAGLDLAKVAHGLAGKCYVTSR